jgi:hypothetical protein
MLARLRDGETTGLGEAPMTSRYQERIETIGAFLARFDPGKLSFADPVAGMNYLERTVKKGGVSFASAEKQTGLRVRPRKDDPFD